MQRWVAEGARYGYLYPPTAAGRGLLATNRVGITEITLVAEYDPVSKAWTELPDIVSRGRGSEPIVVGSTAIDVNALTNGRDTSLPAISIG